VHPVGHSLFVPPVWLESGMVPLRYMMPLICLFAGIFRIRMVRLHSKILVLPVSQVSSLICLWHQVYWLWSRETPLLHLPDGLPLLQWFPYVHPPYKYGILHLKPASFSLWYYCLSNLSINHVCANLECWPFHYVLRLGDVARTATAPPKISPPLSPLSAPAA